MKVNYRLPEIEFDLVIARRYSEKYYLIHAALRKIISENL